MSCQYLPTERQVEQICSSDTRTLQAIPHEGNAQLNAPGIKLDDLFFLARGERLSSLVSIRRVHRTQVVGLTRGHSGSRELSEARDRTVPNPHACASRWFRKNKRPATWWSRASWSGNELAQNSPSTRAIPVAERPPRRDPSRLFFSARLLWSSIMSPLYRVRVRSV